MPDTGHGDDQALYQIAHEAQKHAASARRRKARRLERTLVSAAAALPASSADANASARPHTSWRTSPAAAAAVLNAAQGTRAVSATQCQGQLGEDIAAAHLNEHGLMLLGRNLRCKAGEIDLVARDDATLVFVEVRLRGSTDYGGAAASVNRSKQRRLIRAAHYFLPSLAAVWFDGRLPPCRFDVVSIDGGCVRWIRQAFGADGS